MCAIRTSRVIKAELEQAKIDLNNHYNNCNCCQNPQVYENEDGSKDIAECMLYQFYTDDVDSLEDELQRFNETFEQEYKERCEDMSKPLIINAQQER